MKVKYYPILIIFILISVLFVFFSCGSGKKTNAAQVQKNKQFKILHIMSYYTPWQWTDDQLKGFKESLSDLNCVYKVFSMDTKANSSKEAIIKIADKASAVINEWKPDLVYLSDDNAVEYVATRYINSKIPFVFSGLNSEPQKYGIEESKNITGILERVHFVQSIKLLKEIVPGIKKIGIVIDDDPSWENTIKKCKEYAKKDFPEISFTGWDKIKTFSAYKNKIKAYEKSVDAICIISWFTLKKEDGTNAKELEVARWTAENSRLPDTTFWKDRVDKGTLCSVYVSAYEQGHAAGLFAHKILAEGISPEALKIEPTSKGKAIISFARAKKLKLAISSSILLAYDISDKFIWER